MLTRPSMKILQQCDIKINTKNSVFWEHIPSLNAWIFSTKKSEPISITCKKGRTEKGHITNSGILRLSAGCIARTEQTTVIGTQINVNSEEFIYNPGFSLNISEISPIIYKTMHIPKIKSFFWETEKNEKLKNLHTEESLSTIEEQLLDMENDHYKHKLAQKYWLGGSSILTLLIITTVIYLTQGIIRKTVKPVIIKI